MPGKLPPAVSAILSREIPVEAVDHAAWRDMERWAKRDLDAQVAEITKLCTEGKKRLARRAARFAMQRLGVRLAVSARALRKAHPERGHYTAEQRRASLNLRVAALRGGIDYVGSFSRPAVAQLRPKRKANGDYRATLNFHWIDKARQYLLDAICTPFADFHPAQYMRKQVHGCGGTAPAREALRTALSTAQDGDVFMHIDVRRFYDSVNVVWLERELWLPAETTRRHAHTADMVIHGNHSVRSRSDEACWMEDRWGLPQGSALSPVLADIVMADILRVVAVPEEFPLFVWSDNIGVLVPRQKVAALEELFRSAFAEHGAGPFQITATHHPVTEEFKFLGSWFRRVQGEGVAYIPETVATAWIAKIFDRLSSARSLEIVQEIELHGTGKLAQWAWWPGSIEYREEFANLVQAQKDLLP